MARNLAIVAGTIMAILIELFGFTSETAAKERIYNPAFFHVADKLIFIKEDRQGRTRLVTVSLSNEHASYFDGETTGLDFVQSPSVSPDGSKIVFTFYENDKDIQLGVADADGGNVRKLTSASGQRFFPSYSPAGDRIVYGRGALRNTGRVSHLDLFEIRMGSNEESKLSNFSFVRLVHPLYYGNEERFIFSGEGPLNLDFLRKNPDNLIEYRKRYGSNQIFLLGRNELRPENLQPVFQLNDLTSLRGISVDGRSILFIARTEYAERPEGPKKWGYDLFVRSNEINKRVTNFGNISEGAISKDGTRIAFVAPRRATKGYGAETIWIVDSDGSNLKELRLDLK